MTDTPTPPPAPARMDVMIDIETMGTRPGSAIVSIGAVAFDPLGPPVDAVSNTLPATFYRAVSLESCLEFGLTVDADTIMWWLRQTEAPRAAIRHDTHHIAAALHDLRRFIERHGARCRIWAHGASFDPVLLDHAYHAVGEPPPWEFRDVRDTRTIFDLAGIDLRQEPRYGVAHHALNDAVTQAMAVRKSYCILGLVPAAAT